MSRQIQEPLKFEVAGQLRDIPAAVWAKMTGPLPTPPFPCDGCTHSPDYIGGVPVWAACVIHDFHYRTGTFGRDGFARKRADDYLFDNIVAVNLAYGTGLSRAYARAWLYWGRVRVWGHAAYLSGLGTAGDMPIWERLREAWFVGRK